MSKALPYLDSHGYFALLMEMGTGKTLLTLAITDALASRGECSGLVIIAPGPLSDTWREEIAKRIYEPWTFMEWDCGKQKSAQYKKALKSLEWSKEFPVFFVNVEAFQRKNDLLDATIKSICARYDTMMVVDESTRIKTPTAKRSRAIVDYGQLAKYRMILTGTVVTKTPLDCYMQFLFLSPSFWPQKSFYMFRAHYAILEKRYMGRSIQFDEVVGFRNQAELLCRIEPASFQALKKDCLDLPDQIYEKLTVDLNDNQRTAYLELQAFMSTFLATGEAITLKNAVGLFAKYRQITGGHVIGDDGAPVSLGSPKIAALLDDIECHDEQAIIWAAFVAEIDAIYAAIKDAGYTVAKLCGGMADRESHIDAFKSGRARFIVINPSVGSFGLNFQNCALQYFYSRTLSMEENLQAESRTHRSGQARTCVYKPIVARGTIDERIEKLVAQKIDILHAFQAGSADILELVELKS